MTKLFYLLIFLSINIFAQKNYYIDPINGNDNKSGLSKNEAWKSLKKANNSVIAGDIVTIIGNNILTGFEDKIAPKASGKPNNYIIYKSEDNSRTTLSPAETKGSYRGLAIELQDREFIKIIGFDIVTKYWGNLDKAKNIILEDLNCSFYKDSQEYVGVFGFSMRNTKYVQIKNCKFIGGYKNIGLDILQMQYDASYNLIEYNIFEHAGHTLINLKGNSNSNNLNPPDNNTSRFNIIRNNYFLNLYHHSVNIHVGARSNLIENNIFEQSGAGVYDVGDGVRNGGSDYGSAWYGQQKYGIYRNNIIMKSGSYDSQVFTTNFSQAHNSGGNANWNVVGNRTYNNIFYNNYGIVYTGGQYNDVNKRPLPVSKDNKFFNNIFYMNGESVSPLPTRADVVIHYEQSGSPSPDISKMNDVWRNNLIEDGEDSIIEINNIKFTLFDVQNNTSLMNGVFWKDNIQGDPLFNNSSSNIDPQNFLTAQNSFSIKENSICIDKGTFLTFTVGSGQNKNKIEVRDSRWFIDGWGIVDGDKIQVGSEIVKIVLIDYGKNIITVDRNISWSANTGVALPFSGLKPDIGTFEFEGNVVLPPQGLEKPVITQQPKGKEVKAGENVTFSVVATSSDPIGYQWWKSPFVSETESKIVNNSKFSGATTNQLVISNVQMADGNVKYVCEVYNTLDRSNFWVNSNPVELTVTSSTSFDISGANGLKVYLEGAYKNGKMQSNLSLSKILPLKQPYNNSPWNFIENNKITIRKSNYIDWMLVELRDNQTNTKYRKTGMLYEDGKIMNTDGSDFSFTNISSGKYYIVLIHRNHLSIMSAFPVQITNGEKINFDFTVSQDFVYGNNPLILLEDRKLGMISGDGDANHVINNLDFGIVANKIPTRGYEQGDLDMNGVVNVLDYENINRNILKSSQVPKK